MFALLLSSVSLRLQLQKTRPAHLFERYLGPVKMSDYEYRTLVADQQMIKDFLDMNNGMGVPFVREPKDDHQTILCRMLVSEKHLPSSYDERKKALLARSELEMLTAGPPAAQVTLFVRSAAWPSL
jgi:hypothetical protein